MYLNSNSRSHCEQKFFKIKSFAASNKIFYRLSYCVKIPIDNKDFLLFTIKDKVTHFSNSFNWNSVNDVLFRCIPRTLDDNFSDCDTFFTVVEPILLLSSDS